MKAAESEAIAVKTSRVRFPIDYRRPLMMLGAAFLLVITLFAFTLWQSGAFARSVRAAGGKFSRKVQTPRRGIYATLERMLSGRREVIHEQITFSPGTINNRWLRQNKTAMAARPNLAITMNGANIAQAGLFHLRDMPNLRSINLNDTPLTDECLTHLASIPELHSLSLVGTGLSVEALRILSANNNLGFIHIDAELLTDIGLKHLADIPNMFHLGVHGATDEILRKLAQFPRLRSLYLTEANLSDKGLSEVHRLPNLRGLVFVRCTMPAAAVGRLAVSLPGCLIKNSNSVNVESQTANHDR